MAEAVVSTRIVAKDDTKTATASAARNFQTLGQKIDASNKKVSAGMRNFTRQGRAYAAQFGYQIQDIAVQIQGGQNALMVLGQQGSQIASIFGSGGALLGALVAVGAAIASSFTPALFAASEAMKELGENTSDLISRIKKGRLGEITQSALEATIGVKASDLKESQRLYEETMRNMLEARSDFKSKESELRVAESKRRRGLFVSPFAPSAEDVAEAKKKYQALLVSMSKLKFAAADTQEEIKYLAEALTAKIQGKPFGMDDEDLSDLDEISSLFEKMEKKSDAARSALLRQARAVEEANNPYAKYYSTLAKLEEMRPHLSVEAYTKAVMDAEDRLESFNEAHAEDAAKAFRDQEQAMDSAIRVREQYIDAQYRTAQALKANLDPMTKHLENIKNYKILLEEGWLTQEEFAKAVIKSGSLIAEANKTAAKETKSEWEKAMEAMQGNISDTITDAIMNFKSLGDVVTSIGRMIFSMAIKKQIAEPFAASLTPFIPKFDGGGYTGMGSRSGGVDGKGGFPAILHPNETVVDHTKGQKMGGDTINVTYSPQVNALDPRTAATVIAQNAPTVVGIIEQAMNRRGRTAFA